MSIKRTIEKYGPSIFSIIGTICLGILDFLGLVNHEAFKTFISEIITITSRGFIRINCFHKKHTSISIFFEGRK